MQKKLSYFLAGSFEQFLQGTHAFPSQMAELLAVYFSDRPVEFTQEPQSLRADTGEDLAAVFDLAAAGDEAPFLEAVQQACDIGIATDHALADFSTGKALGRAAQNAEYVVLGRRNVGPFQYFLGISCQKIRRPPQTYKHIFFGTTEAAGRFRSLRHGKTYITRYNDNRQDPSAAGQWVTSTQS